MALPLTDDDLLSAVLSELAWSPHQRPANRLLTWTQRRLAEDGGAWFNDLEREAVKAGVFARSSRQKQGLGRGQGTTVVYGVDAVERFLYLLEGASRDLSMKRIARAVRLNIPWWHLEAEFELRAERYQAMRPMLMLLNSPTLPSDAFLRLWAPQCLVSGTLGKGRQPPRNDKEWDRMFRVKGSRELFTIATVLEPPDVLSLEALGQFNAPSSTVEQKRRDELIADASRTYFDGLQPDDKFVEAQQAFRDLVDKLRKERDPGEREQLLRGDPRAKEYFVAGYQLEASGRIRPQPSKELTLLQQAYSHLRELARTKLLDEDLQRCQNYRRCRAPYFFPWRGNEVYCANPNCRKDYSDHTRQDKPLRPSSGGRP